MVHGMRRLLGVQEEVTRRTSERNDAAARCRIISCQRSTWPQRCSGPAGGPLASAMRMDVAFHSVRGIGCLDLVFVSVGASFLFVMLRLLFCVASGLSAADARGDPVTNLRLAPPADPLPQVSKLIGELEASRRGAEADAERSLQAAFDHAVADGRARVHELVANTAVRARGGSVAFLAEEAAAGHGKFLLTVSPPHAPSGAVRSGVAKLDRVLASEEAALTQQACREMGLLVDIVEGMLKSELSVAGLSGPRGRVASFLASSGDLNVRLSASDAYPTVAELVAEMEDRRAEGEAGLRQRIAEMQLKLLQELNGFASEAFAQQK